MELEITWKRAVKVWWSLFWRHLIAVIVAMLLGGIIGFIMGFIMAGLRVPMQTSQTIMFIATPIFVIIGLLISIVPMNSIIRESF